MVVFVSGKEHVAIRPPTLTPAARKVNMYVEHIYQYSYLSYIVPFLGLILPFGNKGLPSNTGSNPATLAAL